MTAEQGSASPRISPHFHSLKQKTKVQNKTPQLSGVIFSLLSEARRNRPKALCRQSPLLRSGLSVKIASGENLRLEATKKKSRFPEYSKFDVFVTAECGRLAFGLHFPLKIKLRQSLYLLLKSSRPGVACLERNPSRQDYVLVQTRVRRHRTHENNSPKLAARPECFGLQKAPVRTQRRLIYLY